jgi:hypothetical protein
MEDKFRIHWPQGVKQIGFLVLFIEHIETKCEHGTGKNYWQQSYWEAQLQDCLYGAAKALLSSYECSITKILVSK